MCALCYILSNHSHACFLICSCSERSQVHVKYMPPLREIDHSTLVSLHGVTCTGISTLCVKIPDLENLHC